MRPAIWSPIFVAVLFQFTATETSDARPADCRFEVGGARPVAAPCDSAYAETALGRTHGVRNETPNAEPPRDAGEHAADGACRIVALASSCMREADSGEPKPPVETCCATAPAQIKEPSNSCMDMTGLPPLESASTGQKPIRLVVEALLHDAETIYAEGARLITRKPRTESEAVALSKMAILRVGGESFPITECNFQFALSQMMQARQAKYPKDMALTLERISQFDNLIYDAVRQALTCSNTQAQFELTLSRQMLDHASMEFSGHPDQRNWNPGNLAGPQTHEACIDNLPKGIGLAALGKIIAAQIQKFQKEAP
jgi:hypothetical protein